MKIKKGKENKERLTRERNAKRKGKEKETER